MSSRSSTLLWSRWVVANGVGELVGLGLAAGVGFTAVGGATDRGGAAAAIGAAGVVSMAGAVEGAIVGAARWLVLRRPLPRLRTHAWIVATGIGALIAWVLGMIPSTVAALGSSSTTSMEPPSATAALVMAMTLGLVAGTILALPQWRVPRQHVASAGWWILANAAAWTAGMPLIFGAAGLVSEETAPWVVAGTMLATFAATGVVVGAVHGVALVWLLRRGVPTEFR